MRKARLTARLSKPVWFDDLYAVIVRGLAGGSSAPAPAPTPASAASLKSSSPLRILLAEDNPVNQVLAVRILSRRGHSIAVCGNGREALARLDQEKFDVLLTDMQMPEMDGFETAEAIRRREQETGDRLPIVAMTALALKGDRERCLAVGMDAYVTKPVRQSELIETGSNDSVRRLSQSPDAAHSTEASRPGTSRLKILPRHTEEVSGSQMQSKAHAANEGAQQLGANTGIRERRQSAKAISRVYPMTKSAILFIGAALLANFAWAANPKISKDLEGVDPQQETEVIVQFAKAPTRAHHNMVESRGGVLRSVLPLVRAAAYKMRAGTLEDLANEPDVVYITPNRPLHSTLDNVTSSVNATTAWNMGLTGAGVGVAVIDSGISYGQDLDSTIVVDNEWFTRYDGNDT